MQVPLYTTTIDIEIHVNLISKYIHDMFIDIDINGMFMFMSW